MTQKVVQAIWSGYWSGLTSGPFGLGQSNHLQSECPAHRTQLDLVKFVLSSVPATPAHELGDYPLGHGHADQALRPFVHSQANIQGR